jgi:hypothetical protein
MAHRIEEEWNAKLASAHNQHLEDLECIINDLNKRHSDKITRVKCELETSHREEIARLRLETVEARDLVVAGGCGNRACAKRGQQQSSSSSSSLLGLCK